MPVSARVLLIFCALFLAATDAVLGQSIERIELQRRGKESEISIQFSAPIQYLQHLPLESSNLLLIYTRPQGNGTGEIRPALQSIRFLETDMVPRFTVTYPEFDNALTIAFDLPTAFTVQQGPDGRSIRIAVPTLTNAKDWALEMRGSALAAVPRQAAPPAQAAATALEAGPSPASRPVTATASLPAAPVMATDQAPPPAPTEPAPVAAPAPIAPAAPISPVAQKAPELAPLSKDEIEAKAKEWLNTAEKEIAARRGVVAAERLNQVLALPPNSQTETAQALMGEAREFSGELSKARAEYELYLKLYPNGGHASRVKERLSALNQTFAQPTPGLGLKPGPVPATWMIIGGLSQYYYTGQSQIETITPPPPGQLLFNRDTLSLTDQRSLISNLDLQGRRNDGITDTRLVIRDTDNRNYLDNSRSYNRLYSAYLEQTNKDLKYFFRAGRQVGSGGGVFGRFDGLSLGYNLDAQWRVNAVGGSSVEFNDPFNRSLYGMSVDYLPQLARPGISLYVVEQKLEGISDRRAVGTEVRYFDTRATVFGMLDYDINYDKVNILMLQGNLRSDTGTNYFANVDIRKTPPLTLTTALPGQISLDPFAPTLDFRSLFFSSVNNLGVDEMRNQALLLTADSYLYGAGFTHQFTQKWQLGADYRQASVSGTSPSGILPAQPGTGTNHVISGQALGNTMWLENDALVLNGSYITAPTYSGQAYNITYVVPYNDWRFDTLLRYYLQSDDQGQKQTRLAPTVRLAYRIKNRVSLELEGGMEIYDEIGPVRETHSRRYYIFGGYRWDFQ